MRIVVKPSLAWIGLLAAIAVACGGNRSDPAGAPVVGSGPRAIVLVTVEGLGRETIRADAASAPVLSELAGRPENASKMYTPMPLLLPAMTSLMTGADPRVHRLLDGLHRRVPASLPTLAEDFQQGEWNTAAMVASPVVSEGSGLNRGFDHFDGAPGYSIATRRYYPEVRRAQEFVGNAVRWLEALPKDHLGLLWIQFSDLALPYDPKVAPPAMQAKTRLEQVDEAISRLRAALRAPGFGASLLVVTADHGQVLGARSDLDGGFFLDPAVIEIPFLTEWTGMQPPPAATRRPASLTGVAAYLCDAAGLASKRVAAPAATDAPVAMTAVPWVSARWSPAVATVEGDSLWLFDGAWARHPGSGARAEAAEKDVPPSIAERTRALVADLSAPQTKSAAMAGAEAAARKAGLAPGSKPAAGVTPPLANRRATVEALEAARTSEALNRPAEAVGEYRPLASSKPPLLAALHDMAFLQSLNTSSPEPAWETTKTLLAAYGIDRMTLHAAAHAMIAHGNRDLARAFLLAYLDAIPGEPDALYDLACIASLNNDLPSAQDFLERAIGAGFIWWQAIEQDPDLRNLRGSPGFAAVMKKHGR